MNAIVELNKVILGTCKYYNVPHPQNAWSKCEDWKPLLPKEKP